MSPAPHAYLDQKYDETTELGLTWAGAVEVRDAYEWDPSAVIEGAEVVGRRGRAVDRDDRDPRRRRLRCVFPRLPAVAEVGWSARARLGGLPHAAGRPRPAAGASSA